MKRLPLFAAAAAIVLAVGVGGDGPTKPAPSRESLTELLRPIPCDDPPSREVLDALEKPVDFDYDKVTLSKVVDELRPRLGGNFMLDEQGLQNAMVDSNQLLIAFHCRGLRLRNALEAILKPHGLTIAFDNQMLYVTDRESQKKQNVVVVYPVGDLCFEPGVGGVVCFAPLLVNCATETVDRDVWEANGGDATMRFYQPTLTLTVSCPPATHLRFEALLKGLRAARLQRDATLRSTGTTPEQLRQLTTAHLEAMRRLESLGLGGLASHPTDARSAARRFADAAADLARDIEAEQAKREAAAKAPPPVAPPAPEQKADPKRSEAK